MCLCNLFQLVEPLLVQIMFFNVIGGYLLVTNRFDSLIKMGEDDGNSRFLGIDIDPAVVEACSNLLLVRFVQKVFRDLLQDGAIGS